MTITKLSSHLYLIDLEQKIRGFRNFICSWLIKGESGTILVDPGPLSTIDVLLKALEKLEVKSVDVVLLTHIHIDHAGGAGRIVEKYPMARVICHPKGIKHLINPDKLWQGSLKVLGDIAAAYGEIIPVPEENIGYEEELETPEGAIHVYETPGHALHHLCYRFKDLFFAGEVAGVGFKVATGLYARPATPPVFKL
jgi:glyoxylase-like metal-dependent hydrolase (beta-lactamase superfamily II)